MVDINADGWLDIYVCNAGLNETKTAGQKNKLFINNKDNTFSEQAQEYGLDDDGYTTHAAFFDYDKDGDLDSYILNNSFIPVNTLNYSNKRELRAKDWPVKDFLKGGGDKLLKNENGKFVDVSEKAGIFGSLIGFGLGVNIGDVNNDGWLDIYVSNDFFERDYLYINQKDGTFSEELELRINHISMSSMGADIADINNDNYPEIFTTDMLPMNDERLKTTSSYDNIDVLNLRTKEGFYYQYMQNALQLNNGDGTFDEIANFSGVAASDWSWGALMFDADNDMLNDIYVCNGIHNDVIDQDFIDFFANEISQKMAMSGEKSKIEEIIKQMPSNLISNCFFHNKGKLKFKDIANEVGLGDQSFSNGAAYGDLDNDGDLDLIVNNVNQSSFIYKNNTNQKSKSITLNLKGDGGNTFAIGSKIELYIKDQIINREVIPSRGFQSSVDYKQVIGVGTLQYIDSIKIKWPNDKITIVNKLATDSTYIFDIKDSKKVQTTSTSSTETVFVKYENTEPIIKHEENDYLDFYQEYNIPFLQSRDGPAVAKGDVNGDGLEDVFIGSGKGQIANIYLNTSNNGLVMKPQKDFLRFMQFEDTAAELFDADGDKDLDLIIGSGGNEASESDFEILPRLFLNDGNGNFTITEFPKTFNNISVITAHDFDADGDQDLFIGSSSKPKQFGSTPQSYIAINNKGKFSLIDPNQNKDLCLVGNVKDAKWSDIDGDNKMELIIVGDWMCPTIFKYENGKFIKVVKKEFENKEGLYGTVHIDDVDNDGDNDLIVGNIGENFNLHADVENPVKLFINDFDNNGTVEKILTKTINGKDKPVYLKREITQQMPSLKKKSLKHKEYAVKSIDELLPSNKLGKGEIKTINEMKSYIAYNDGKGNFTIVPLTDKVQFSNVNAIHTFDIDDDKIPEIFIGGNSNNFSSNFTKLDANHGIILKRQKDKSYDVIPNYKSGYRVNGETKRIIELKINNKSSIVTIINNQQPIIYTLR